MIETLVCESVPLLDEPTNDSVDLREHAIFTLRHLLEDNLENQRVVKELKPLRDFDAEGILRDVVP